MKCPRCQQENPPQAKFCLDCATPLALRCASCGTPLPAGAKFCFECATPVGGARCPARPVSPEAYTPKHLAERIINSKAALEGGRKQVTVLFADLKGSMELLADRDPEEARRILDPGHTTRSLDELAAALAGAAYHISAALKERDPRRGGREQRCILEDPGQGEEPT